MTDPNFVLLYVSQPTVSAQFYSVLLGYEPIESAPTFAMFALSSGVMLGLWGKEGVLPGASLTSGGAEIAIAVKSDTEVDGLYQLWCSRGLVMIQTPCALDLGRRLSHKTLMRIGSEYFHHRQSSLKVHSVDGAHLI